MASNPRRLPVYLLLDCSGSMSGEPIEAVKQGMKMLVSELRNTPQALETAYLSVITFDSDARQVAPLTELLDFEEPEIDAGGLTSLGAALNVLMESVDREVRKTTETQKGDWKPLVFILTDGMVTDEDTFEQAVKDIRNMKAANIIACGAGSGVDTDELKKITDTVIYLNSTAPSDLAAFFQWLSASVSGASQSLDSNPGAPIELAKPPANFVIVP